MKYDDGPATHVKNPSEQGLIERIRRTLPTRGPNRGDSGLRIGIGDDAAVLRPRRNTDWVVSTDAFIEDTHFLLHAHPPAMAGYKALARASSDLAAMGARPRYFLMNLALPTRCTRKWLDEFLGGMARAARNFGMLLAGGDTTVASRLAINLAVIGEVSPKRVLLRSGARPGDLICVSGVLGEAAAGLTLLRRGHRLRGGEPLRRAGQQPTRASRCLRKHLLPEPRLALGAWLANRGRATAAIDISDGLSTDLRHLCQASGAGARLWRDHIPVVSLPPTLSHLNALDLALHGGDDYELLFTIGSKDARLLPRSFKGVRLSVIGEVTGEVTRGRRIVLADTASPASKARQLSARGWDPFRKRSSTTKA